MNFKEIATRFDIVGFLQQYVEIRPYNRDGEYEMHCPFCEQMGHTPKLRPFVNARKGIFHCFRCTSSGSTIDLVMHFGELTFGQALNLMEDGIDERHYDFTEDLEDHYEDWRKREISEIKDLPTFPLPQGFVSLKGQQIDYTRKRRLSQEVIDRCGIGYCPPGSFLVDPETGVSYDYSERLVIPDTDINGRVLYWTARDMTGTHPQKYKNPPSSLLSIGSGSMLFNFHRASLHPQAVLVEGYLDAMRVGDDCMAHSGMGLKGYHLQWLLRGNFKRLTLLDDADGTVPLAHVQKKALQLSQFFEVYIGHLPCRGDPDSFTHRILREVIAAATPFEVADEQLAMPEPLVGQ